MTFFKTKTAKHLMIVAKTFSWRTVAAIDSAILIWWTTGSFTAAGTVVALEAVTKIGWFYLHELAWSKAATIVAE